MPVALTEIVLRELRCRVRRFPLVRRVWHFCLDCVNILMHGHKLALDGNPGRFATSPAVRFGDRLRWGALGEYIWLSRRIPGWTRGDEAAALARASYASPDEAVIVEIGSFLGCSTILLAGARKLRGSGKVHCVDAFDTSGDAFSVPIYRAHQDSLPVSLRKRFDENIRLTGLTEWVEVHQGRDSDIASGWKSPIDLLFMDGDHSVEEARQTYQAWSRFLKSGGVIAIHNSRNDVPYAEGHDGSMRLVAEAIRPPRYADIHCIGTTTFARRLPDGGT